MYIYHSDWQKINEFVHVAITFFLSPLFSSLDAKIVPQEMSNLKRFTINLFYFFNF